jgi:hypothetical protein
MKSASLSRNILSSSLLLALACGGTVPLGSGQDPSVAGGTSTGGSVNAGGTNSGGSVNAGGTSTGGSVNTGGTNSGGSVNTGGTFGGIDCSRAGCSAPPLCSVGCTAPCGCCPCSEGTVQNSLACTNGCWATVGGSSGAGGTSAGTGGTPPATGGVSLGTGGKPPGTGGISAGTGGSAAATGGETAASGGNPGSGGTSTSNPAATGGITSVTSSSSAPQCTTVNGTMGWAYPGQALLCSSNCVSCIAVCNLIGTRSEGWYVSCGGTSMEIGCSNTGATTTLIQFASCGSN